MKLMESGVETLRDRADMDTITTDFYDGCGDAERANPVCININTGQQNQLQKPRTRRKIFRNALTVQEINKKIARYKMTQNQKLQQRNSTLLARDSADSKTLTTLWPKMPERPNSPTSTMKPKVDQKPMKSYISSSAVVKSRQSMQNSMATSTQSSVMNRSKRMDNHHN